MGGAIPGLVVLCSTEKQAEQALGKKPVSSPLPWPLYQLLLKGYCPDKVSALSIVHNELLHRTVSEINIFLSKWFLAFGHGI